MSNEKTPAEKLSHPAYRADIDGLRAISVLSVVFFHAFPQAIPGGFIGVDVFFVISGFLISKIIFDNIESNKFEFLVFYKRRVLRIFPSLFLSLIFVLIIGWSTLISDEYEQLGKHVAAGAAFISNFVLSSESGYFDTSAEAKPLLHLWSLGIEEQFYLIWPLAVWAVMKLRWRTSALIAAVILISFGLNIFGIASRPVHTFYAPQARFWELLAGSALAWASTHRPRDGWFVWPANHDWSASKDLVSLVGLALILGPVLFFSKNLLFPGGWALLPVLGAVLLIASGERAWVNRNILAQRAAVWFGLISFPLYLWHWPLLSYGRILEGDTPVVSFRVGAIVCAVLFAWLCYRFVERPLRSSPRSSAAAIGLCVLMTATGATGYYIYRNDGLADRKINLINGNQEAFDWRADHIQSDACRVFVGKRKLPYCLQSSDRKPTVALLGDSHGNALFPFFDQFFAKRQQGVLMLGSAGCPPFLNVDRDGFSCKKVTPVAVEYVVQDPSITDVYLTGRFAAVENGTYSIKSTERPQTMDRRAIFKDSLEATIKKLADAKKKITIILHAPELDFDPRSCLASRGRSPCAIDKNSVLARQAGYRKIIRELGTSYSFRTLDLLDAFCDAKFCYAQSDGKILYRDSHHLGVYGLDLLARKSWGFP